MTAPLVARVLGVAFCLAALASFIPAAVVAAPFDAPWVTLDQSYGFLGGIFPVNLVHDGMHAIFGGLGIVAAANFASARRYLRAVAWIYGILTLLGAIPITDTLFGVAPIYGWDVALHGAIFVLALYGGYGRGSIDPAPLHG